MRRTCQKRLLEKGGECIVLTILLDEHLKVLVDGRDGKQDAWGGARRQGEGGVKRLDWSVRAAGVRRVGSVSGAAQLRCVTPRCPSEATCTMSSRVRCMSKYLVGVSSAVQHGEGVGFPSAHARRAGRAARAVAAGQRWWSIESVRGVPIGWVDSCVLIPAPPPQMQLLSGVPHVNAWCVACKRVAGVPRSRGESAEVWAGRARGLRGRRAAVSEVEGDGVGKAGQTSCDHCAAMACWPCGTHQCPSRWRP